MSDPSKQDVGWRAILNVNARFVSGCIALAYGWLCWQMASKEWWAFWGIAVLCVVGGGAQMIAASFKAIELIRARSRWRKLARRGKAPKADQSPDRQKFKDGGMIR